MLRYLIMTLWSLSDLLGPVGRLNSGYQPPSQPPRSAGSSTGEPSTLAWVTLIAGLASWFILPVLGAMVGVVTGMIELKNIKSGQSTEAGKTITQIGFWASVAQLALAVLGTCAAFAIAIIVYGGIAAFLVALGLSAGV